MRLRDDLVKRERARELRRQGKTYREISEELGGLSSCILVPWVRDISLTPEQQEFLEARARPARQQHITQFHGKGASNPRWKGGITVSSKGYVYIFRPTHPRASKTGYVKRANLVVEEMLGRSLVLSELVHHKNGVKNDDRPENLEVMSSAQHTKLYSPKFSATNQPLKWRGSRGPSRAPVVECICGFCGKPFTRLKRTILTELTLCSRACVASFFHQAHGHKMRLTKASLDRSSSSC